MEITINEVQITSKDLSEITGKRHADIMRDIRKEIEDLGDLAACIFALSGYKDISGKENPMYTFGKDGAMQMAMKYSGEVRIKNFPKYTINRKGEIFSLDYNKTKNKRKMKPSLIGKYFRIDLWDKKIKKGFFVHRLVAEHFVDGKTKEKYQVNHKDGNKLNNNYDNLEWVTPSENVKHSYDIIKTQSYGRLAEIGRKASISKILFSKEDCEVVKEIYTKHKISFRKLAKSLNVGKTTIERVINNRYKFSVTGKGQVWILGKIKEWV